MAKLKYNTEENTAFFKELRRAVFNELPKEYKALANKVMAVKAGILIGTFSCILASSYVLVENKFAYLLLIAMLGIMALPMILNIGHEAVHRNFSSNQKINQIAKGVFYLLGTSAYFWELRHNSSHHAFVNVKDVDLDIEQTTIIRLSAHQTHHKRHRFQHLYMPFAFCLYTLLWFFVRDFKDLAKNRFGAKTINIHPRREIVKLFLAKIWHFAILLVFPYLLSDAIGLVVCGFFVFHLSASITTTFALISTHVGEDQEIVRAENGRLPYSWAAHQLMTTADFSSNSFIALHFFAGFNHHVAHHLFPQVPHVYYPKITPLIKKYAAVYGLRYNYYPNLLTCAKSHFKRLKQLSVEI